MAARDEREAGGLMNVLPRYEANALMADSTVHRNAPTGASGEEIERRNRDLYRNAVAVVVHRQEYTQANKGAAMG
jgi:hypothetical protein